MSEDPTDKEKARRILALDCATAACSVALQTTEGCEQLHIVKPRVHDKVLLPMIDRLLKKAKLRTEQLDLIVCGTGPGTFTGVRIAVAAAQGIASAASIPVLPISSLYALAQQGQHHLGSSQGGILPALDARLGQVYWGYYLMQEGRLKEIIPAQLSSPQEITLNEDLALGLGNGWKYQAEMPPPLAHFAHIKPEALPQACHLIELAQAQEHIWLENPQQLQPVYLRDHTGKKNSI